MKKVLLFASLFTITFTFGQNNNLSQNSVTNILFPASFGSSLGNDEIFRFKPGAITQLLDTTAGADFDFGLSDKWLTIGQVVAGTQTFYGSRFQYDGSALVMGYTDATPNNPRIQWVGESATSPIGNLEFRVGDGFMGPGTNTLVASMTPEANTYFATTIPTSLQNLKPKVGIIFEDIVGLSINTANNLQTGSTRIGAQIEVSSVENANGLIANSAGGEISTGVFGKASAFEVAYGVFGNVGSANSFGAAVYGESQNQDASMTNVWAGYFNGTVFSTQMYQGSDRKLKNNIENEANVLERLSLLRPVTYTHKDVEGISLPTGNQHGFIAQEMAEVFPELTKDIKQPILDDEGKVDSYLNFKAVNYVGLISVLTSGIQELNIELTAVGEKLISVSDELAEYKANDKIRQSLVQDSREVSDYSMEQNIPNPFNDRSIIRYQLAPDVNQASITIFDLNGGFVRDYPINENKGEITVMASEIGKGMFIYSLTRNGQEIMSKRMIVR